MKLSTKLAASASAALIGAAMFAAPATAATSDFTLSNTDNFDSLAGWTVYDDRPDCTVSGGILTLHGNPDGSTCGMAENHNQVYGKYEVRAKFGAPSSHQFDTTFILWPQDDDIWQSAEIDYIEKTDPASQETAAFIHTGVNSQREFHKTVDMTQWHVYGVEWSPGRLVGTLDGSPWFTVTGSAVTSAPRHQTLQQDLNRESGPIVRSDVQVDWFKRYNYTPGVVAPPVITPPVITPPVITPPVITPPPSGDIPVIQSGNYRITKPIIQRWLAARTSLGNPLSNAIAVPRGSKQYFQRGVIYWNANTGAHAVRGAILARWNSLGASAGRLGFPRSEEVTTATGSYVNFQHGAIVWNRATGAVKVL